MDKPGGEIMKKNTKLRCNLLILATALVLTHEVATYENQTVLINKTQTEQNKLEDEIKSINSKQKIENLESTIEIDSMKIITIKELLESDIEYLKEKENVSLDGTLYKLTQKEFDKILNKLGQMKNIKSLTIAKDVIVSEEFSPLFTKENVSKLFEVVTTLENIEVLKFNYLSYISDFSLISKMKNLRELVLTHSDISDIKPLESLEKLEVLDLSFNSKLNNIKSIENLIKLKKLNLSYTNVTNLKPLEGIINLEELRLSSYREGTEYTSISSLKHLTKMSYLSISNFNGQDISFLESMTELKYLSLQKGKIEDISALRNCQKLKSLILEENEIEDISVLSGMNNIEYLKLSHNNIENIDALAHLNKLRVLWINDNKIKNVESLYNIDTLTSLDLRDNQISDIRALENIINISSVNILRNQFSDLDLILFLIDNENIKIESCFSKNKKEAYEGIINAKRTLKHIETLEFKHLLNYDIKLLIEYESVWLNESFFNCTQEEFDIILSKLKQLPNLKNLKIIGPPCYPMYELGIGKVETPENIEKLVGVIKEFKDLEKLEISFVYLLTDGSFVYELPNLTHIDLDGNTITIKDKEKIYEDIRNRKSPYVK